MSKQEPTITLTEKEDGWWTARNVKVGVSSQGETKQEALTRNNFCVVDREDSHIKLRYEHPENEDDVRVEFRNTTASTWAPSEV